VNSDEPLPSRRGLFTKALVRPVSPEYSELPIRPELQCHLPVAHCGAFSLKVLRLDAGPTGDLAFIVTRRGTPPTKGALGTEFVAAARTAGVVGKSAHGMRNAAATRASENGATERELEAIFAGPAGGWRPFIPRARTRGRLAAGAIGKLNRPETENRTSIPAPMAEVRAGNRKSE
jgi:hypothetical protein